MGDLVDVPVPVLIEPGDITVKLVEVAQLDPGPAGFARNFINFTYHSGDDSGRIYTAESKGGNVWIIEANGDRVAEPFIDLNDIFGTDFFEGAREAGLRTFAFHPEYHTPGADGEGKFYTMASMSVDSGQAGVTLFDGPFDATIHSVLTEWTVDATNPDKIDPASRREVFRIEEPAQNLNAEQLMFNPNAVPGDADFGMMYVTTGNGLFNFVPDPHLDVQDLSRARGKVLRLDPLEQDNGDAFGVPADNPFLSEPGALPIVWALGFRHAENLVFDPGGTGRIFINDIGQFSVEEINIGIAGANYGWPLREGTFAQNPDGISHPTDPFVYELPPNEDQLGFTAPVIQYGRGEGVVADNKIANIGGYVYRGDDAPELFGKYLFGDLVSGRIYHVDESDLQIGQQAVVEELILQVDGEATTLMEIVGLEEGEERVDLRFGQNAEGEVFITSKRNGKIYRLEASDDVGPRTITGTLDDDARLFGTPVKDIIEGLAGNDRILGMGGDDMLQGDNGDDHLDGSVGSDTLEGHRGEDTLLGGSGDDFLFGHSENDVLDGGEGADRAFGGNGDDEISGGAGEDFLRGQAGDDIISGGADNDLVNGDIGNDRLLGDAGDDVVNGNAGDDILVGGGGADIMNGGDGVDRLLGLSGDDVLTGGADRDIFVFFANNGVDTITDFDQGVDQIRFNGGFVDFAGLTIQDAGADLSIQTGGGVEVILTGLAGVTLVEADFVFA